MVYASRAKNASSFLQCWLQHDWETIKREWPDYHVDSELDLGDAAFSEGEAAFENGEPRSSNPYDPETVSYPAWAFGWDEAKNLHEAPF